MSGRIDARLKELGITLPTPRPPVANYVPCVQSGRLVFVSGQLPGDPKYTGKLGDKMSIEDGAAAARLCCLNIIAHVRAHLGGDLDKVTRVVQVQGLVNAVPGFTDHPTVVNGASDLLVQVFGEAGKHSRFAVGMSSLPRDAAVEVAAILEVA
ncbi:MAG TPA: RidA family protein [Alphaproteobacteria bacterium]|nr:RidA family protein [Alphaproteobacteria bacterium]